MKKVKYFYNTHTLRYEKVITPLSVKLLRIFAFIATALVSAGIVIAIAFKYIDTPDSKKLFQENEDLKDNYTVVTEELIHLKQQMHELENRDNAIYRSIFEATPIPDSIRTKEIEKTKEIELVNRLSDNELIRSIRDSLNILSRRVAFQNKSYDDIDGMVKNKEKMLMSIPAIQPVSNKDLNRIASGFGYRIDPVYKITKFHAGLDFTAPTGTPIYATANGVIKESNYSDGGYGNHVVINHGYGYETLYGHMVKVKVNAGQQVKRGEVIGWVGSTGKSTGPHCHYEVHKNGQPIDPVYYFYNDISPAQYDRLLKQAAASNQSFD